MHKHYLFDEMVYEDALALGRHQFLEKYDKDSEEFFDQVQAEKIRAIVKQAKKEIKEERTKKEITMGRVNDLLIGMEEEASYLSQQEWLLKYGTSNIDVWNKVQREGEGQVELELPDV